jgi:AcrR family transcriptional regulator
MATAIKSTSDSRLDRASWLEEALVVLAREGSAGITIRCLCERLGVTTGSFYWHFKNREEFIRAMVDFWVDTDTESAAHRTSREPGGPHAQLLTLMEILATEDRGRYDLPMRIWAIENKYVAAAVWKVDKRRKAVVKGLFAAMGFTGQELDTRAEVFVVYHSMKSSIYPNQSKQTRLKAVKYLHTWFTRP